MSHNDCHREMKGFHSTRVTLSKTDQDDMRGRRDSGRTRLKNGLDTDGHPAPKEIAAQGSYAMRTMVQDNDCDYDIDDGVYFNSADLEKRDGTPLTPREARQRVRDALKDDRFASPAQVKTNCVRQDYSAGYHIDLPVYRVVRTKNSLGGAAEHFELASGDTWRKQDARAVTRWYNDAIGDELKSGEADTSQKRRITKLTKKMARSRSSWKAKTTSGICMSKLVIDHAACVADRDDDALRETWKAIKAALDKSMQVAHPVDAGSNLAEYNDEGVAVFRDCLASVLKKLEILDQPDCSKRDALAAWDDVFNDDYFRAQAPAKAATSTSTGSLLRPAAAAASGIAFPDRPVLPNKPSGFA